MSRIFDRSIFSAGLNSRIRLGGFSAIIVGVLVLIHSVTFYIFSDVVWGVFSILIGLCYLVIGLGIYSSGQKLGLNIFKIFGYIGLILGVTDIIYGSIRFIPISQSICEFIAIASLLFFILWPTLFGYALLKISSKINLSLARKAGILMFTRILFITGVIPFILVEALYGAAHILAGITLIQLAGSVASSSN